MEEDAGFDSVRLEAWRSFACISFACMPLVACYACMPKALQRPLSSHWFFFEVYRSLGGFQTVLFWVLLKCGVDRAIPCHFLFFEVQGNQNRFKMEPRASKINQKLIQTRSRLVQNRSKRTFGGPEERRGRRKCPQRARDGQNGTKMVPKWNKNGIKMEMNLGPRHYQIRSSQRDNFWSIVDWFSIDFQKCFRCILRQFIYYFCPRSEKCDVHETR